MRGEVYRLKSPRDAKGHEQQGSRYAVVVQADVMLLSTWLVAPTSTSARQASFRPEIDIAGKTTRVLVERTRAIDPQRLGEFAGRLSWHEMSQVDGALRTVLGL
ncbi:MAG: type II toxin-antitoxin system PemK/MazF family toxin [Actinophytocola sp.]|nr:type II toxin-antitoxin system PemK/MazF family toxin [Actinophytocola sp.]